MTEVFQVRPHFPAPHVSKRHLLASASLGVALSISVALPSTVYAAPEAPAAIAQTVAQNVDYISTDAGYALDLGFSVLVPGWVPSPFGGPPAIDAGGGYYSLYWMNAGGDPTFLQVSGQVGGALPAGSPYDLNNELFINASVQGYGAIHDVTPAYDAVWWIAGGVLYKVESRNSATDSLTLANSLIPFAPPSEPEPTPVPVVPTPIPQQEIPQNVDPVVVDERPAEQPANEVSVADDPSVEPVSTGGQDAEQSGDTGGQDEDTPEVPEPEPTEVPAISDGTGDPAPSSDGTGGAQTSVIGGDGTGGTIDVVVPRRTVNDIETP